MQKISKEEMGECISLPWVYSEIEMSVDCSDTVTIEIMKKYWSSDSCQLLKSIRAIKVHST